MKWFPTKHKGGVHITQDLNAVPDFASKMLGNNLITKQTGAEGQKCSKIMVSEGISIERELYFAIIMDRAQGGLCIIASTEGGMNIEEVPYSVLPPQLKP